MPKQQSDVARVQFTQVWKATVYIPCCIWGLAHRNPVLVEKLTTFGSALQIPSAGLSQSQGPSVY